MRPLRKFNLFIPIILIMCLFLLSTSSVFGEAIDSDSSVAELGQRMTIDGKSTIVISPTATTVEKQAAQELQAYIKQISGLELTVSAQVYGEVSTKLYIGSAAPSPEVDRIRAGGEQPESFRLHVTNEYVQFVGLTDKGTQYAVYELLEQLGVRWIMPGEIGTVVPTLTSIRVKLQDTIQHPGYATRLLVPVDNYPGHATVPKVYNPKEGADWAKFMRLGGENFGKHGLPCTVKSTEKPDWFIQENGKPTSQYDVSKPEVLACVVEGAKKTLKADPTLKYVGMGPNDAYGFGHTAWDADDLDPLVGQISVTDRYVKFYNLVLAELQKEYPNVGIAFYAYTLDMRPPVREIPNPKLLPVLAPINLDRLHAIDNPLSWERDYMKNIIEGWQALGVKVMYRGYLFDLAEPSLPFSITPQIKSEFAYFKDHGIERIRVEVFPAWAYQGPGLYLAAKMMWNPELDVEALLDDYFEKFYGPAAEPMREHFKLLENAFEKADYFAGSAQDFPHILTKSVLKDMEKALSKAEKKVRGDSVYAQRVAMVRTAYDFGDAFIGMLDANSNFDFVEAKRQLDRVNALSLQGISHSPVILNPLAQSYIMRFWGNKIEEGYSRVTGGNTIVAKLPDEMSVFLDPYGGGEKLGLWKPGLGTQSWMTLKTASESWSAQGLRYYKGHAWYRTSVKIPNSYSGKPIRLWLEDIDETVKVWVNGKLLPVLKEGKPLQNSWEFDATGAVEFGKNNVIAIDVGNMALNELGTGGIVGPAMFWTPAP